MPQQLGLFESIDDNDANEIINDFSYIIGELKVKHNERIQKYENWKSIQEKSFLVDAKESLIVLCLLQCFLIGNV